MKHLCTSIGTVYASTKIFLLLVSTDSAQYLEPGSKQQQDFEHLIKQRFNIETMSTENGQVGSFLRKEVDALSRNIEKLEREVSAFEESYGVSRSRIHRQGTKMSQ